MSRITIEDCINVVGNRFRLVMYGAQRGREIASGMQPAIEADPSSKHEKSAVIALREIVQGQCDQSALEESIIRNHRRYSPIESVEEVADGEGGVTNRDREAKAVTSSEQAERVASSANVSSALGGETNDSDSESATKPE